MSMTQHPGRDTPTAPLTPINALALVPLQNLVPDRTNPRDELPDIDDLTDSVARYGVQQPLIVQRLDARRFLIIDGHRRYEAAVQAGLSQVPCILAGTKEGADLLVTRLLSLLHGRPLNAIEEARAYNALIGMRGGSYREVAALLNVPTSRVEDRLELLSLPLEAQDMVAVGALSPTDGLKLARDVRRSGKGEVVKGNRVPSHFTRAHALAAPARRRCNDAGHSPRGRVGGVACGQCWEAAIREDAAREVA